jgi:hypothetical protein
MSVAKCPLRRCGGALEQRFDALGRMADFCAQCDRRRRGICRDCTAPVEGAIGKAVRCASHKHAARLAAGRRMMSDPAVRAKKNVNHRKYSKRPEVRARKNECHRAWVAAHPEKKKEYSRRYLLKQSPRYLATQRRHNRRPTRAKKKRDMALAKYYQLHPVRPDPHCTGCGVAIAWTPGQGRPRLTCDKCCTPAELRRRQRGDNVAGRHSSMEGAA